LRQDDTLLTIGSPVKIILGVGGGIAAYKSAELARLLMQQGHEVQAVMTSAAQEFIRPLTFAARA
jgi:phosphopantothenoylcysteine decarboxylase/phosphopantothenate--cysteine ligase